MRPGVRSLKRGRFFTQLNGSSIVWMPATFRCEPRASTRLTEAMINSIRARKRRRVRAYQNAKARITGNDR